MAASAAAGVWDIEGRDQLNTDWIGTLVLTESDQNGLVGHIHWVGSTGHCGREYLTARLNRNSRQLQLSGLRTKFANQIARGSYTAVLSQNGNSLNSGKWGSGIDGAVPGAWQAHRLLHKLSAAFL